MELLLKNVQEKHRILIQELAKMLKFKIEDITKLDENSKLDQAIKGGIEDLKQGRVTNHDTVMKELKAKYNL
jgi:predicted transcriptional regulator